jgi:hypothetical protein
MKIFTERIMEKAMIKSTIILVISLVLLTSKIIFPQQIKLIYPADGGFVENNAYSSPSYPITWSGPSNDSITIYYSIDDGITWQQAVVFNSFINDTTTNWSLPDTTNVKCKIKVVETSDTTNFDQNQIPFTLYSTDLDYIAINEILMWINNNGVGSHNPYTGVDGLIWPGGINGNLTATYSDGFWWTCLVDGEKRANGSYFSRSGIRPGIINNDGQPSDPTDSSFKIWKIRKDWESLPPGEERDAYEFDYNNWPAEIGAPWEDINGDGVFTRGVDLPKFIGEETLWYVSNDLDTVKSLSVFGSLPIGLEFQVTTWGHKSDVLKDVVFKKYRIINKENQIAENMILGFWSDDDLGFAGDDYPGCDSLLNLEYVFNGDNEDEGNYFTPPPAIGRMIIQAPIVSGSQTDSARYGYGWRHGYKNLRMSAYSPGFKNSSGLPQDVQTGVYEATIEVDNLLHGLNNNGDSLINPYIGYGTIFPLNGDPESGTGWYCGEGWPGGPSPGDRRSLIPSGPFTFAPGDTNEFVFAVFLQKGTDNLNSITKLKQYAAFLQNWYNTTLVTGVNEVNHIIPSEFSLSQNFPNPFNPTTSIQYQVPSSSRVTLKVYDILGNEVANLVNAQKPAGKYKVEFDATNLASGVYFYRMQVNPVSGVGGFTQTKKMVVLK